MFLWTILSICFVLILLHTSIKHGFLYYLLRLGISSPSRGSWLLLKIMEALEMLFFLATQPTSNHIKLLWRKEGSAMVMSVLICCRYTNIINVILLDSVAVCCLLIIIIIIYYYSTIIYYYKLLLLLLLLIIFYCSSYYYSK